MTRNTSANSQVVLSIHPEVEKAVLVFYQKKKNELNFYIKTIALITNPLDKMQQQLPLSLHVVQHPGGAGCDLWGRAGRERLPSTGGDNALWNTLHVPGAQCQKLVGIVS